MASNDAYRLISACYSSPEDALALLAKEPEPLKARTGLGETALHYLSVEDQLEAVRLLVEHGAEVNTINECGGTPLSEAASLGYVDLVAYLLGQGAKLDLPGQHEPILHDAVRGGNPRIISMLLASGAEVEATNDLRETALHVAAEEDSRLEILRLLLDARANVDSLSIFDETPLDIAKRSNSFNIVAELLARQV
ncbi:MAG TPA: ankyrin repeat domain-containing protein [Gammaproteobacteria bacterium]